MTSDPPRLKDRGGPARQLLRAADLDRPSNAARRRALAVASAVTTLGATSAVAAATSGAVAKGVLFWVCVGAAGGSTMALAVSELVEPGPTSSTSATQAIAPVRARASSTPDSQPVVKALPEPASGELPDPAPQPPAQAASSQPAPGMEPWMPGVPAASAASFGDDPHAKPTLFEELRLIEAARASVGRGAPSAALSVLDAYDKAYPGGQFQPEALALRIQSLSQSGDKAGARALLTRFQARYPRHPLLPRALAAVGD